MIKLSQKELREIVSTKIPGISPEQQDEMAIPSYLHHNPAIRWLMWRRYEIISHFLQLKESKQILEFGCGIGLFLPELSLHAKQIFAIDLFPDYAKILCEKRQLAVTFISSLDEIEDRSIDAIIAADVLEHIDELEGILQQFYDKLSPGGCLIISGPTENLIYRLGRILAGFSGKGNYHHTNIGHITKIAQTIGLIPTRKVTLPFSWLPHLFEIHNFSRPL